MYSLVSCTRVLKKSFNVASLASLPVVFCHVLSCLADALTIFSSIVFADDILVRTIYDKFSSISSLGLKSLNAIISISFNPFKNRWNGNVKETCYLTNGFALKLGLDCLAAGSVTMRVKCLVCNIEITLLGIAQL